MMGEQWGRVRDRYGYIVYPPIGKTGYKGGYNKPIVDHIDRDRSNNFYKNLRWVTYSENHFNKAQSYRSAHTLYDNRRRSSLSVLWNY